MSTPACSRTRFLSSFGSLNEKRCSVYIVAKGDTLRLSVNITHQEHWPRPSAARLSAEAGTNPFLSACRPISCAGLVRDVVRKSVPSLPRRCTRVAGGFCFAISRRPSRFSFRLEARNRRKAQLFSRRFFLLYGRLKRGRPPLGAAWSGRIVTTLVCTR